MASENKLRKYIYASVASRWPKLITYCTVDIEGIDVGSNLLWWMKGFKLVDMDTCKFLQLSFTQNPRTCKNEPSVAK